MLHTHIKSKLKYGVDLCIVSSVLFFTPAGIVSEHNVLNYLCVFFFLSF